MTSKKLEIIAEPGQKTITTRRVLDAPRALVFEAWTKPEYIKRWLGPAKLEMVGCDVDLRVGGRFRYVHRGPDGQEYAFSGVYREIVRPERLSCTSVFEMMPDFESLETVTFEERDGKTTVTTLTVHKSVEGRDGHLSSGAMESGMTEGYARLDELLASLDKSVR